MRKALILSVMTAVVLVFSLQAHAALENRGTDSLGNQLIYDTDLNITWYDYTNGAYSWDDHMSWATGLDVDLSGTHYTDWRLPVVFDESCSGYDCTNSEMGHLYYTELGNRGGDPMTDFGSFQKLSPILYLSGTEYSGNTSRVWAFDFVAGGQMVRDKIPADIFDPSARTYAVAVRTGDIAVAPEPVSMVLFGAGGVVLAVRRKLLRR